MKIQYNFKIEKETKKAVDEIAKEQSEKLGFNITSAEMTRKIIDDYVRKWQEDQPFDPNEQVVGNGKYKLRFE